MTTRIYRASPGRWVSVTRHPSGGVVRETYTSGWAALVALDGRNREKPQCVYAVDWNGERLTAEKLVIGSRKQMLAELAAGFYASYGYGKRADWILR